MLAGCCTMLGIDVNVQWLDSRIRHVGWNSNSCACSRGHGVKVINGTCFACALANNNNPQMQQKLMMGLDTAANREWWLRKHTSSYCRLFVGDLVVQDLVIRTTSIQGQQANILGR